MATAWQRRLKRLLDILLSAVALLVLSPVLLGIAAAVRIRLGAPVFFRQVRQGRNGAPFTILKFRTMTDGVDGLGRLLPDEQRLTALGRFLRASSLDELPELINVLKGEMSLVGPRPLIMAYVERYTPRQARRMEVAPGITGLAQVSGRNALTWEERFELDVRYVERWSLWLDLTCSSGRSARSSSVTVSAQKGTPPCRSSWGRLGTIGRNAMDLRNVERTPSAAASETVTFAPWPHYGADEIDAATEVLRSGKVNYWTGQQGRAFEAEYAQAVGRKYGVAVGNGTLALELALEAFGVGPGDEVITTSRTFIASASAAVMRGATPVIADVDRESQNVTAETIAPWITERTRAIIPVHLAGWPCEMDGIMDLAREHDLVVIEDCAQANGATYRGRPVGSFGHAAAFSFCQDKIITTGGEGGMLLLDDEDAWRRAWSYKDHGKSYEAVYHREHPPGFRWLHESFGTNWRMTEFQAAIGRVQLGRLPESVQRRREHAGGPYPRVRGRGRPPRDATTGPRRARLLQVLCLRATGSATERLGSRSHHADGERGRRPLLLGELQRDLPGTRVPQAGAGSRSPTSRGQGAWGDVPDVPGASHVE